MDFTNCVRPGTIKSYLGALKLFYKYLISNDKENDITNERCINMVSVINDWQSSIRKKVTIRKRKKQLEDLKKLVEAEEIIAFEKSDLVGDCKLMIEKRRYSEDPPPPERTRKQETFF